MTLATTAAVVGIAGGVNSLTGGSITNALGIGPKSQSGAQAQTAADPFSPYRDNLAKMYSGALQPGQSQDPTQMPGYSQFKTGVMDPALEASKRSGAASGMLYSGNEQLGLQKTAQQGYYGFMTDYLNRLAQGSGAVNNPAPAASSGTAQGNWNQGNVAAGFGGVGQGLSQLSAQFNSNPTNYQTGGAGSNYGGYDYTSAPADMSGGVYTPPPGGGF